MKRIVIFLLLCPLLLAACELFDGAADPDFLDKLFEEVAWANAPWVPLRIEPGILGTTSLMGSQPRTVKLGYSFKLFFQPDRNYPFQGWQAWVDGDNPWSSYWLTNRQEGGEDRVLFIPLNDEGTEVEIFIYEMPPPGLELNIGPLGAARGELTVMPDRGGLGIIHPSSSLTGIIQGYPFTMSFQPSANYPFRGWQVKFADGTVSEWEVGDNEQSVNGISWVPRNAFGTEISITIDSLPDDVNDTDVIIVGPIGMDSPELTVSTTSGGLGTVPPITSPVRLGYSFAVSFQPMESYPFRGWQVRFDADNVSVWKTGDEENEIDEYIRWEPQNASGTEMRLTIINLPDDFDISNVIIIGPLGMENTQARINIFSGGLGTIVSSIQGDYARVGYSFTVSFQPSASYPFQGWQLMFDEENISVWTGDEGDDHIDEYVNWEPQNASGTEMRLTILRLPDDADISNVIIIGPLGMENPQTRINIFSGGLGTIVSSIQGDYARVGYSFTVSFQPSAGFPFQGWQLMFDEENISVWTGNEGDDHIDDYVNWEPQNASGTEMRITIIDLPDDFDIAAGSVSIMPVGAESMPASGQVIVPAGWGSANMTAFENRRQSFPFAIEFTPSSEWSFVEWRAYTGFQSMSNMGTRITDASQVKFDDPASLRTQVTINLSAPVTLVPFCFERPKVEQASPPLINSGAHYTRGQQITIWMDLGFTANREIIFSANLIQITGQHASGEATGSLAGFFNTPVYNADSRTITIEPNTNNYPPGNLNITVSVGTGVLNQNGVGMISPVVFSYRINNEIVTRAYKASNVWANHNPANDSRIESFFFQTAPTDRDRRLRKNSEGKYEVTLYFGVSRSVGEITDQDPDSLIITEVYYTDLAGRNVTFPEGDEYDYDIEGGHRVRKGTAENIIRNNEGSNNAGGIYRLMNPGTNPLGMSYYRAVYTFPPDSPAGIYRLAVQPLRAGIVPADDWQIAIAEGSFVTVVLDNKAPGGTGMLNFSGHYRLDNTTDGNVSVYSTDDKFFTMRSDFSFINDNLDGGGILLRNANPNLPWTMDEQRNLFWQWQIVRISGNQTDIIKDYDLNQWLPFGTNPAPLDLSTILPVPPVPSPVVTHGDGIMQVRIMYRDSLGNESPDNILGRIAYVRPPDSAPVSNWSAIYNATANSITVRWTTPNMMDDGVEIKVGDATPIPIPGTGEKFYNITGVGQITPSVTSDGVTITGVQPYEIMITAKRAGNIPDKDPPEPWPLEPLPEPIKIWNIPGMVSTEESPIIELTSSAQFTSGDAQYQFASSVGRTYVITQDIPLTDHIPIGTEAVPFSGRIFSTGRKINVNGLASDRQYNGVFGYVDGAVIQYLDVIYPDTFSVDAADSDAYVGGIAAYSINDTRISNSVVRSGGGLNLANNTSGTRTNIYIGGIAGRMTGGQLTNCISAVNVSAAINRDVYNIFAGGLSGTTGPAISASSVASGRTISVSLATPDLHNDLTFWQANDVRINSDDTITITGAAPTHIRPSFRRTFTVSNFTDSTNAVDVPGTLRHALANAQEGTLIDFTGVTPGTSVIELFLALPEIKGNLTIEGNGITIIPNWTMPSDTSQILRITDAGANVKISRVHFKNGRATGNGAAIHNTGNLTLESCIFTDNHVSASNGNGSAIWSGAGNLTVSGCTFYNNRADNQGSIFINVDGILNTAKTVTLTGILFYGNTAWSYPILRSQQTTANANYNVVNTSIGTGSSSSGFSGITNSTLTNAGFRVNTTSPFITDNLAPFANIDSFLPASLPAGFPETDFYGAARTRAPGAVNHGTGRLYVVNSTEDNSTAATTAGTLRHAITNAQNDDIIRLTYSNTIRLTDTLPEITRRITIEGNGSTLIRATGWTSTSGTSQFIRVGNSGDVKISRLAFSGGIATEYGGAINNRGQLTLESCIFYDNNTTTGTAFGGAIWVGGTSTASLTVKGCTFLVNNASQGGAIYIGSSSGRLNLTGNLFYANFASSSNGGHIVRRSGGTVTSYGFNVVDMAMGTLYSQSGFTQADGDHSYTHAAGSPVAPSNFRLRASSVAANRISTLPQDYPKFDFYGDPITPGAAAGAVQGNFSGTESSFNVDSFRDDYRSAGTRGTLRYALTFYPAGSTINIIGPIATPTTPFSSTITLIRTLPQIHRNVTIEGNGVTITNNAASFRMMEISSGTVTIRRIRFTNSRAGYGGAVYNSAVNLTIESCIFDNNSNTNHGGAVYNATGGTMRIRGCTFYRNQANWGGAIFNQDSLTTAVRIAGNIFYDNSYRQGGGAAVAGGTMVTSQGGNHADRDFGPTSDASQTTRDASGYTLGTGAVGACNDRYSTSSPFTDDFNLVAPRFNPNASIRYIPINAASGAGRGGSSNYFNQECMPALDFLGQDRQVTTSTFAPGAIR